MSDQLPQPGDLFASRYRIANMLGKGGFGAVFQARDTSLERDVALKVLMRVPDEQALARFLREARATAALASEHVATIYEVGSTADGPYIVMELLRGCDLQDELDDKHHLSVEESVGHVLQAALGVAHAHARGIVHRDLKPRNLFLARRDDGTTLLKVLDFGIAKSSATDLTQTGTTLGTPRYMAPEQLRSARAVDARTDVWALGVVLYELLSGRPIFDGDTATQLAVSIVIDPHVPLRTRKPELPAALEAIVDRCLAKEPDDRYASVHALAVALAPFASTAARALVPRIERALSDRTSGAIAKASLDETIASPSPRATGTDATVASPSHAAALGETATSTGETDATVAARSKTSATDGTVAASPVGSSAAASRPRAEATAPSPHAAASPTGLVPPPASSPRAAASPTDGVPASPAPASTNRTALVVALAAIAALVVVVVLWMRDKPPTAPLVDAPRLALAPDAAPDTAIPDATAVVELPDAAAPDALAVMPVDASIVDAGRIPITTPRPTRTAPSADEIEKLEGYCYSHTAPLFVVPNNEGPMTVQCGRVAMLGCQGVARACKSRSTTDTERRTCQDFIAGLQSAGVCR